MHPRSNPPRWKTRGGDPGAGCVAASSNTPGILGRRALPPGRLAGLGTTPDYYHGLLTCQQVEDLRDRPPADRAERHVVAREHDAIGLRPVITARLVVRALERTDFARVRTLVEQRRVAFFLVPEERV